MATFSNGESGFSVRTKINDVLQHMDGTAGTLVVNEAGADVDFRVESDTNTSAIYMDGATGYVGLGTSVPVNTLHMFDNTNSGIRFQNSTTGLGGGSDGTYIGNVFNSLDFLIQNSETASLLFSTSALERMRISAAGNVGIGTSAPASLLHVNGTAGGGAIFSQAGYNYATVSQVLSSADAVFGGGVIASSVAQQVSKTTADAAHYMKAQITEGITFHTNITGSAGTSVSRGTNERMRITAAGNVGVGTPSPEGRLDVSTTDGGVPTNSPSTAALRLISTATAAVGAGPTILFRGQTGNTTASYSFGAIQGFKELSAAENYSGSLAFFTQGGGGATFLTEQMRITSAGLVGIGTAAPAARLHVLGGGGSINSVFDSSVGDTRIELRTAGTRAGYIYWDASENRFFADSSRFTTFYTGGSERMRLDSAGDLALGDTVTNGYRLTVGRPNPARGILANISNQSTSAQTGSQVVFTQNGIANWVIGQPAAVSAFSIWSGRNAGQDGVERLRLDASGNLGLGSTPSAWGGGFYAIQFSGGSVWSGAGFQGLNQNAFYNGTNWIYRNTAVATNYDQSSGSHKWFNAPSGTAGNAITFTQAMTLDTNGDLAVGATSSATFRLHLASGSANKLRLLNSVGNNNIIDFVDQSWQSQIEGTGGNFVFRTGGTTERMRIDNAGGVGIGTTTPQDKLQVSGGGIVAQAVQAIGTPSSYTPGGGIVLSYASSVGSIRAYNNVSGTGTAVINFLTSGTERARIDDTGNLLVGATTPSGSASNAALTTSGGYRTASGGVSTTSGVAATAFSITAANRGRYDIVAMVNNSGTPAGYTAIATVIWDGTGGRIIANDGANLTITLSGSNVQVTQTSGSPQTVNWSFTRIASQA